MRHLALLMLALATGAQAAGPELKSAAPTRARFAETVVISPGYRMLIAGKPVPVTGAQQCPRADGLRVWFLGGDPMGGDSCLVIEKTTTTLQAQFTLEGNRVSETWTVERPAPDKTVLRRPNGDYLQAVTPFF